MLAHEQLQSGASLLDLRIATSSARPLASHALIIVHGLPKAMGMGRQAAGLLPELAEHMATESGWIVATGTLSGVGGSTGTFSATQWRAVGVLSTMGSRCNVDIPVCSVPTSADPVSAVGGPR